MATRGHKREAVSTECPGSTDLQPAARQRGLSDGLRAWTMCDEEDSRGRCGFRMYKRSILGGQNGNPGLYARRPPSARNSVRRTIVQLQRPSPQPTLTWNRPEPLLSGHFSDTAPHLCPFFANLRCTRPRVSLPAPAAPRSSAASRRRAAGSDDLPPAGASSIWRASPAGLRFSPAAAGDSSATSA